MIIWSEAAGDTTINTVYSQNLWGDLTVVAELIEVDNEWYIDIGNSTKAIPAPAGDAQAFLDAMLGVGVNSNEMCLKTPILRFKGKSMNFDVWEVTE